MAQENDDDRDPKMMKADVEDKRYKVHCEVVRVNLEVTPQKKFKALQEAKEDTSKMKIYLGFTAGLLFCGRGPRENMNLAAKYTIEGEGHAQEGWQVFLEVLKQVCTDFNEELFDILLKES